MGYLFPTFRSRRLVVLLLGLPLCPLPLAADISLTPQTALERFDANQNGTLDPPERSALRAAFGDIDVPLLPATPLNYSTLSRPAHLNDAELRELDNTPENNPITDAGATLGRVLFYDTQLSRNNTISCASCHRLELGFSDPRKFSVGYEGGQTSRNAMGLVNLRYSNVHGRRPGFFWDERAGTLEDQALMPIQDKIEMGMELPALTLKLHKLPYYPPLFEAAFGSAEVTSTRIAKAIAQFMRSAESWDTPFDRAAAQQPQPVDYTIDFEHFTPEQNRGKDLFINGLLGIAEFGCAHCHVPPTFNMAKSMNNGLDLSYSDPGLGALNRPSNDPFMPSNDGKFKSPSLRNVELTAPYMHDGRFRTLDQVIEHYSDDVQPHVNLALAFEDQEETSGTLGFHFTQKQKASLVAFLKTLTDRTFANDSRFADPFIRLDP